jgi:hypothetical protein
MSYILDGLRTFGLRNESLLGLFKNHEHKESSIPETFGRPARDTLSQFPRLQHPINPRKGTKEGTKASSRTERLTRALSGSTVQAIGFRGATLVAISISL